MIYCMYSKHLEIFFQNLFINIIISKKQIKIILGQIYFIKYKEFIKSKKIFIIMMINLKFKVFVKIFQYNFI